MLFQVKKGALLTITDAVKKAVPLNVPMPAFFKGITKKAGEEVETSEEDNEAPAAEEAAPVETAAPEAQAEAPKEAAPAEEAPKEEDKEENKE